MSAECWGNTAEGSEGVERQQQHGCASIAYLGHGEVAEGTGGVHALLAVHRGEWRGCGVVWCFWRGVGVVI